MSKWREVIEDALVELGELEAGDPAEQTDLDVGLRRVRGVIALMSADGGLVPRLSEYTLTVPNPSKAVYKVGPGDGADLSTGSIVDLKALKYQPDGYTDPYELDEVGYGSLIDRSDSHGTRPSAYLFEVDQPVGILRLNAPPLPGEKLILVGYGYLVSVIELEEDSGLSDEYELAIALNLAVSLAPGLGITASRDTKMAAKDAVRVLRKRNRQRPTVRLDSALANMNYGADSSYYGRRLGRY